MPEPRLPARVLVTGAGGFVGRWLLRALGAELGAGSVVVGTSQDQDRDGPLLHLDVTRPDTVQTALADVRPTAVIHLAGISTPVDARKDVRRAWDANLAGTLNVAEALRRIVPECRLIFASTAEVYGQTFNRLARPVDETAPVDPVNVYGATKAAAEIALGQLAVEGLDLVRLRLFNHTGPGQTTRFVVPAFAAQIADIERNRQPPVLQVGNLEAARDFLDIRDVVRAYGAAVMARDLDPGMILNIASGTPRRIADILSALIALSPARITVQQDPTRMRPHDTPLIAGNAARAWQRLGWQPKVPWETTLADVLADMRHDAGR